jgi:hypothetical protein
MECGVVALTRIERKKFLDIGSRTKYLLHPTFQTLKSSLTIMTYKPMETGIGIQQISSNFKVQLVQLSEFRITPSIPQLFSRISES